VVATLRERHRPGEAIVVTDSVFGAISLCRRFEAEGERPPPLLVVPALSLLETRSAALLAPEARVTGEGLSDRLRGVGAVWPIARPPPPAVRDARRAAKPAVGGHGTLDRVRVLTRGAAAPALRCRRPRALRHHPPVAGARSSASK
jgi:hypothetical protein